MNTSTGPLTARQLDVLAALAPDKPVVMFNLLRFRDQAAYSDPQEACSGREAYKRYARTSFETIAAVGGEVIFSGKAGASVIGPPGETWDQVFLVRYPSVAAFRAMLSMPQYQAAVRHRTAALKDSRLMPITPYQAESLRCAGSPGQIVASFDPATVSVNIHDTPRRLISPPTIGLPSCSL